MKNFQAVLCVISVVLSLSSGQVEDFEYEEEEIETTAGKVGNGTLSEHLPFMASLRLKLEDSPFGNGHICGAVFITRQHLLTAAVCVVRIDKDYSPEELEIVAGVRNRYDDSGSYTFKVSQVIVRSEYLRWPVMGMDGNLAILKLSEPVPDVISTISTVEYTKSPVGVGAICTIYGWGEPKSMKGSQELQKGQINVLDRSQCAVSYHNHFCAGPSNIGGCSGDDGGAVICDEVLYGLVGWRHEDYCTEPYKSHLYVDIAAYHQWIHDLANSSSIFLSSSFLVILSSLTQILIAKM